MRFFWVLALCAGACAGQTTIDGSGSGSGWSEEGTGAGMGTTSVGGWAVPACGWPWYACGSVSLAPITYPAAPNVGGVSGAGSTFFDPLFGTPGVRVTDAYTSPAGMGTANNQYAISNGGSASDHHLSLPLKKADPLSAEMLLVTDPGTNKYLHVINPRTLEIYRPYASYTSGCPSPRSNCSSYRGWGVSATVDFGADPNNPCVIYAYSGSSIVSYTFGSDVAPWPNDCSPSIVGPPAAVTVFNFVEASGNCLPLDFGTPTWTSNSGVTDNDYLLGGSFSSAKYHWAGPDWQGSTAYTLNTIIHPTAGSNAGYFSYKVTVAGTSSGLEPNWAACQTVGSTCSDGGVTWTNNNTGAGQDTGIYTAVWNQSKGCMAWNTMTGAITADQGWAGSPGLSCDGSGCTGTGTFGSSCTIHSGKLNPDGRVMFTNPMKTISGDCQGNKSNTIAWITGTTTTYMTEIGHYSGHGCWGYLGMLNNPGSPAWGWYYRSIPSTPTPGIEWKVNTVVTGQQSLDTHCAWQTDNATDTAPFVMSATTNSLKSWGLAPNDQPTGPWWNEIDLVDTNGDGLTHREALTFNTGYSTTFSAQNNITTASRACFAVGSDWYNIRNAGGTSTSCIPNGPTWHASWNYSPVYGIPYTINPAAGTNAGNYSYQISSACVSGTTEPATWNQTVAGTQSDGTCTWTNIGVPSGVNACGTDVYAWCPGAQPKQPIPRALFGASFRLQGDWPPVDGNSQSAKIYATRIWDDWVTYPSTGGLKWSDIQPTNTTPTFTNLDIRVRTQALPAGMSVIYTFGGMVNWASACAGQADASACLPGPTGSGFGGGLQCKGPTNYGCLPPSDVAADGSGADAYYAQLANYIATRYAGQINYYEIWNEADAPQFWCYPHLSVTPPASTCGSIDPNTSANAESSKRLVRMAWDLKNIIHCIDPAAKILSPSFHVDTALTWFHYYNLTSIQAPGGVAGVNGVPEGCNWPAQTVSGKQTYDYVNVHARGNSTVAPSLAGNWNPDAIAAAYNNTVAEIANDGLPNPGVIFNDEYGYNSTAEGGGNVNSYSAYVARGLVWCASLGFAECLWYQWDSQFGAPLAGTATGTAYDTTVGWLTGAIITAPCAEVGTLYTCGVRQYGVNYLIAWDSSTTCNPSCTYNNYSFGAQYGHYADLSNTLYATSGGNGTAPVGWQPIRLQP